MVCELTSLPCNYFKKDREQPEKNGIKTVVISRPNVYMQCR